MHQVCSSVNRFRLAAPLVLRIVLGGLFIWHGIDKFDTGISMVEGAFRGWDVPVPGLTAPLTRRQFAAGTALVLGIGTRIEAMLLSVVSIGALIYGDRRRRRISSDGDPCQLRRTVRRVGISYLAPFRCREVGPHSDG